MTYAKSYIEFRGTSRREFFEKKTRQAEDNLGESRGRDGGRKRKSSAGFGWRCFWVWLVGGRLAVGVVYWHLTQW